MITAKILNSDALLNNFKEIGSLDFVPGAEVTLVIRLFDTQLSLRHIPPAAAITKIFLNKTDGTILEKTMTPLTDDRSIQSVVLEEAETDVLLGGNFTLEIDVIGDGSKIEKGMVQNGLRKIVIGDC